MSSDLLVDDTFVESPPEKDKTTHFEEGTRVATPPQPATYDLGNPNVKTTEMRDKNWQSGRQSILNKYDKNGDGIYDTAEVNAIVDDYMTTIKNNNALIETTQGQKKLLVFSGLMIFILSLSNLGTGFLAANLAKDVRVDEDGMMASTANGKAIKTMNIADSISAKATWDSASVGRRRLSNNSANFGRRKLSNNPSQIDAPFISLDYDEYVNDNRLDTELDDYDIAPGGEGGPHACFTKDQVKELYNNVKKGSSTSITLTDENDPNMEKTISIGGKAERQPISSDISRRKLSGEEDDEVEYVFEDANVSFRYAPDKCSGRRRLNDGSDTDYALEEKGEYQREKLTGFETNELVAADLDAERKKSRKSGDFKVPPRYYLKNGVCTRFYTNPLDIPVPIDDDNDSKKDRDTKRINKRRDTYVRQVRPCGHYDKIFSDANCVYETTYEIIEANVDYPARGEHVKDFLDNLYLVRFDVGSQPNTKQFASGSNNINFSAINFDESGSIGEPAEIMADEVEGETCVEVFTWGGENFGHFIRKQKSGKDEEKKNKYGCMGYCGDGCQSFIKGKDCMKHDVCSYYKSLIQDYPASGFSSDVDCGDEAAQTVINCWQRRRFWFERPVICGPDENIYAELIPVTRFTNYYNYRVASTLRSSWEQGQGMIRPWNHDRIMGGKTYQEWKEKQE